MRYLALAADYDGTLATNGLVPERTVAALERLVASGRKLILVTGRVLPDLLEIFPRLDLCERIVAENGALLYRPASKELEVLAPHAPRAWQVRAVMPWITGALLALLLVLAATTDFRRGEVRV